MLELGLEEASHLHSGTGRAGDADRRQVVGLEDLFDPAVRYLISLTRLPVAGHDDTVSLADREHRRAMGNWRCPAIIGLDLEHAGKEAGRNPAEQLGKTGIRVVEKSSLPGIAGHRQQSPPGLPRFLKRSAAVGDSAKSCRTWASVPRRGSSMKIFLSGPSLKSKITESHDADTTSSEYFCRHMPRK